MARQQIYYGSYEWSRDRSIQSLQRDAATEGHCKEYRDQAAAEAARLAAERDAER